MPSTVSISFNKLSKYNFGFISLEEVLVLELLLFHHQKNNLNNLVATRMADETGLKKSKVLVALDELEKKGFVTKNELEFRTSYQLNLTKIIDALPILFKKEYRNIFRIYHKINMPEAFRNTAQKQRKSTKLQGTKNKNTNKPKKNVPVQISLFDM